MKIKKVVSLLLTGTMLLGLAACGSQNPGGSNSNSLSDAISTESTESKAQESSSQSGVSEKPITITVAPYMFNPVVEELDTVTPLVEQILLEKHGINVNIETIYIENSNYREVINTQLAGGAAPDLFLGGSTNQVRKYAEQGVIATFDMELLEENAPSVVEWINNGGPHGGFKDFVDLFWEEAMVDDEIAWLPNFQAGGSMPGRALIYRGDWLEKLGVSEDKLPQTVDEFVELMYRFAKEDPDGNGVDDTYGFGATGVKALFGAYGLYNGFIGNNSYWTEEDGELINADVHENAKKVIEIMAQMYADGVIDPEFVTGNEAIEGTYWAISNGFVNGLYGVTALSSIDHYRPKGIGSSEDLGGPVMKEYWAVNGEDSNVVYGPWPAGPDGDYGTFVGLPITYESCVYNVSVLDEPGKLETIFRILEAFATDDELFDLAYYGVEGEHYTIDADGNKVRPEGVLTNTNGYQNCRGLYGPDRPFSDYANEAIFYNSPTIAYCLSWFEKEQYDSYITNAVYVALPSGPEFNAELNTYRDETWVDMIRGEISLDEWDNYVETYMSIGGQTLYDEANEWYASK